MRYRPSARTFQHVTVPIQNIYHCYNFEVTVMSIDLGLCLCIKRDDDIITLEYLLLPI